MIIAIFNRLQSVDTPAKGARARSASPRSVQEKGLQDELRALRTYSIVIGKIGNFFPKKSFRSHKKENQWTIRQLGFCQNVVDIGWRRIERLRPDANLSVQHDDRLRKTRTRVADTYPC